MLNRFSNITILVLCGFLVVGIIISRRVDTAIEWQVKAKNENRTIVRDFSLNCGNDYQKLIALDTAQWVSIRYNLPNFSSYNLDRVNNSWQIEGQQTDLASTSKYLGKIGDAKWRCLVEHSKPKSLKVPDYVLEVITINADTFTYKTYVVDTNYIIQDHTGQLYSGNSDSLFWQLYFGKHRFIPSLQVQ